MIIILPYTYGFAYYESLSHHMEVKMNNVRISRRRSFFGSIVAVFALFTIVLVAGSVFAHGGKKHADSFTALQALQKSADLFNQLVGSGKLDESWETDLANVGISNRQKGGNTEYVVSFQRSTGDPRTVYIFFTADGKYSGSNFTGE
jgi:predicted PurR-regulated permease PerM